MQTSLGVIPMKHPVRSDFDIAVTEAGVTVTFKPTNSIYSFYRLADSGNVARLGPVSLERVRHAGASGDTETLLMKFKRWRSWSRQKSPRQFGPSKTRKRRIN
jgi:hypothetical protein